MESFSCLKVVENFRVAAKKICADANSHQFRIETFAIKNNPWFPGSVNYYRAHTHFKSKSNGKYPFNLVLLDLKLCYSNAVMPFQLRL